MRPAALAETHLSVVVMVGDRAWKLPKPVTLAFVDQSTPELRRVTCEREVALNRRLAPDVYLGVLDVVREGVVVDHLVEMRRLPDDRRLGTLITADAAGGADEVRAVARCVAAFHAAAERSAEITAAGSPDAVARLWDDNLAEMAAFAPDPLDPEALAAVGRAATTYLDGRRRLLEERQAAGHIVDGHGDLLAEDIFCLPDGPRILDCLAFDARLRRGDVLLDLAFLAMDLEARGRDDLARHLLGAYGEFSAEAHPVSLAHHYIAYRALVRSKIACLRIEDEGEPARDRARDRLDLACAHLDRARVRLVLVGGAPGTGKTTLAGGLADRTGWAVLDSDELRKDLAGVAHHESAAAPVGEGIYQPEMTEAVYENLLNRAARLLERGESVLLDASWTSEAHRAAARAVAEAHHAAVVELRCVSAPSTVEARVAARARRGGVATDADAEVARHLAARQDPWPTAVDIDTEGPTEVSVAAAAAVVDP